MLQTKRLLKYFFVVFLALTSVQFGSAQNGNPELARLRAQLALDYLKPAPHLALARYYWSKGDRLQAFYISEYARRARFPVETFDPAFQSSFGGASRLGGSQGAATWLEQSNQGAKKEPDGDKQTESIFNKAAELQRLGKLKQAEELFVKAAELSPDSVYIQSWVGRFFYKVKADNERALHYYLNAYFLDAHAYETEFVESRIRKINWEAATNRYRQMIKSGAAPNKILDDSNPTVAVIALEQMSVQWKPEYLKSVLEQMSHDDETVRWQATEAIMKNVNRSFDETLLTLLADGDLRKRGLAAYIAVHLWKQESFDVLRNMLREKAELLRFDALSALTLHGGSEGLRIVLEHRAYETNPTLKQLIDKSAERR